MISNKEIINFLSSLTTNTGFVDKLKIKYRPIICPFDKLLSYVGDKKSLFDIGCGSGQFCLLAAKFTGANKFKGVEITDRLVKNANEIKNELNFNKELDFSVFDGKILPDDIKNYEIIYLIDVIHHVPPKQQMDFIKEIYNKMSIGATLVFKDMNASHPFVLFNKIHDLIFAGEIGNELKPSRVKEELLSLGFKINEESKKTIFVYPHYFFICKK
jgi:SAM-dependent methyltransferase